MTSTVAIWILLGIGLLHFLISCRLLWKQFHGKPQPFTGLIPLQFYTKHGRTSTTLAIIPRAMLGSLLWPATFLWACYLMLSSGVDLERWQSQEGRSELSLRMLGAVSTFFPVATLCSAAILLGASIATFYAPSRPSILIWLGCVWVALVLWLVSAYIPNNSIGAWVRTEPEYLRKNLLSLVLLFGLVFPIVSSVIATCINNSQFSPNEVLSATYSIYSLGVLWEGPKHALAKLTRQPSDLLQLATGTVLYLVIITKIRSVATDRMSNGDLQVATIFKLIIGDLKRAGALMDRFTVDDSGAWNLRIVHSLMRGDVERAKSYCVAKIQILGEYGSRREVVVPAYLAMLPLSWKTPKSSQKEIWEQFLAANPSEDEFLLFWISLSPSLDNEAFFYTYSDFVKAAQERDYFHALLIGAITKRQIDPLPALAERAARECSISPATTFLTAVAATVIQNAQASAEVREQVLDRLEGLSLMSRKVHALCGLLLVNMGLEMLARIAPPGNEAVADWLNRENDALKEKVLMYPHGQEIFLGFQATRRW